ncbi:MAG: lipopolysaccharide biosynthesis protein [Candidatus Helarchaeota archaeon]
MGSGKNPSLIVSAISNWSALGISVIVGFLLTPFIISHIGKTGYGIWVLIGSIIGYYGILDLGVTSAITRYVARYFGQKNYVAISETINTALVIFFIIGIVIVCASFIIAKPLSNFFDISINNSNEFRLALIILGISAAVGFPGNLFGAVLRAHENFVTFNVISGFIVLIRAGLIILFLSNGFGLLGVAYSHLISSIINVSLNYLVCKLKFSYLKIKLNSVSWSVVGILFGFGAATTVGTIADIMRFNLDSFVIGKWVNVPSVAIYGIAALMVRYYLKFSYLGAQIIFIPRYSAIDGKGQRDYLRTLFLKSLSISSFLSFCVGTLIIIFGRQFILLWVGEEYLDAVPVLFILTGAYAIALAQTPGISLVYALKKHYLFAAVSIVEGITNFLLSIYLASRYGIIGVAMGTAIPMFIVKLFVQPIYISRIIGISIKKYFLQLVPSFCLSVGLIFLKNFFTQVSLLDNGYISIIIKSIPFILIFLMFFFLIQKVSGNKVFTKGDIIRS